MVWIIQPLELKTNEEQPSGKWRLTARSDEDGGGPYPLCDCKGGHSSAKEAALCSIASEKAGTF